MTDTLGIKRVYDLRSQTELDNDAKSAGRQVKEWDGSERVFAPVFSHEDYSPEAIAKRFSAFASTGNEVSKALSLLCIFERGLERVTQCVCVCERKGGGTLG